MAVSFKETRIPMIPAAVTCGHEILTPGRYSLVYCHLPEDLMLVPQVKEKILGQSGSFMSR